MRFVKKWRLTWIVAGVWLCHAAWAGAQVFHIATYNIENFLDAPSGTRPAKSPEARRKVRDTILAIKPDVIALEEVGSTNVLLELQSELKIGGWDLPYWDQVAGSDTNIHVSVLTRFPIVGRRPHTNDQFLLSGHLMQVSRGFAELDLQVNPKFRFTLIAAHLKSRRPSGLADEEEWRYEEAAALRHVIDERFGKELDPKFVVLGDFNDLKDSKPVRAIMGRGGNRLFDTRPGERNGDDPPAEKSHDSRRVTWTHFYAKDDVYSRVDYILLSSAMKLNWLTTESYVFSAPNWGLASDHRPVVAGFTVETK